MSSPKICGASSSRKLKATPANVGSAFRISSASVPQAARCGGITPRSTTKVASTRASRSVFTSRSEIDCTQARRHRDVSKSVRSEFAQRARATGASTRHSGMSTTRCSPPCANRPIFLAGNDELRARAIPEDRIRRRNVVNADARRKMQKRRSNSSVLLRELLPVRRFNQRTAGAFGRVHTSHARKRRETLR